MTLQDKIYDQQAQHTRDSAGIFPSIVVSPNSVDAWRHDRVYEFARPLADSGSSWLTVGDSGGDAIWLKNAGCDNVTSSSIDVGQIDVLKAAGVMDGIAVKSINAESIDLPDASFDFVCCKEAYHHFPRAFIGLYEMLRVARKGVVLLAEPHVTGKKKLLDHLRSLVKFVLRRNTALANEHFESSGNYIFGLALPELQKVATGLQLHSVYYRFGSDFYERRINPMPMSGWQSLVMRTAVGVQDTLSAAGLMNWARISAAVFKAPPSEELHAAMIASGAKRYLVQVNPYI